MRPSFARSASGRLPSIKARQSPKRTFRNSACLDFSNRQKADIGLGEQVATLDTFEFWFNIATP